MADEQTFRRLGNLFKKIHLEDGDVLLVKWKAETDEEDEQWKDGMQAFADNILAHSGKSVIIISVESLSDIKTLSDVEMRKWGWVRADTVLAYKDDLFEELAEREDIA